LKNFLLSFFSAMPFVIFLIVSKYYFQQKLNLFIFLIISIAIGLTLYYLTFKILKLTLKTLVPQPLSFPTSKVGEREGKNRREEE